jgi:hypothetical protein
MNTPNTSSIEQQRPAPDAILAVCRRSTQHIRGQTVYEATITDRGVRVRLSSWPRQQQALRVLRDLGYAAIEDDRPPGTEHGSALLVTSWDLPALAARAERLEAAIRVMEKEFFEVTDTAIHDFREQVDKHGLAEDAAATHTIDRARRTVAERPDPAGYVSMPISAADLAAATNEAAELLIRVQAGEIALGRLQDTHAPIAEAAIGLYQEYRHLHGCSDEEAAAKALTEVVEGLRAVHEIGQDETEYRHHGIH